MDFHLWTGLNRTEVQASDFFRDKLRTSNLSGLKFAKIEKGFQPMKTCLFVLLVSTLISFQSFASGQTQDSVDQSETHFEIAKSCVRMFGESAAMKCLSIAKSNEAVIACGLYFPRVSAGLRCLKLNRSRAAIIQCALARETVASGLECLEDTVE